MIHYHGTPITPRSDLYRMAGKNFCISFIDHRDTGVCLQIGQSVMLDNGAFSLFTRGEKPQWGKFYKWIEDKVGHPHWAVVPDVIGGEPKDNLALAKEYPHRKDCACVVWHMSEPISHMFKLLELGFTRVAFGSSDKYWQIGSDAWCRRCDEAWNALAKNGDLPWVHMMRGLSLGGKQWPFASADSTNVALHHSEYCDMEFKARQIDSAQCPVSWKIRDIQKSLL